jgi:NAD(P)-dependent dehydrogenase (short-subunit alcohol dehydrogenase family)
MVSDTLSGRVALITGGAGGLGLGIARALREKGAAVVLGDIDPVTEPAGEFELVPLDVTREPSVSKALETIEKNHGCPDLLVNNAGVCLAHGFLEEADALWERTFNVNVRGTLLVSRLFARRLIGKKQAGSIVNIASNAARRPYERFVDYNASKAAVVNLTHTLSRELAAHHINVNALCPGAVDTRMLAYCMEDAAKASGGAFSAEDCRKTWGPAQLGRLVQPIEVGRVAAFLAGNAALVIRGQAINVDAGDTP